MSVTDEPLLWQQYRSGIRSVELVPVRALRDADSPRLAGERPDHVRALAASALPLTPIVVHRGTMRVIDGMHRLRAATLRAQEMVEVVYFDGDEDDAFVLAVEANTATGLPLTAAERRAAAERIIGTHPRRSDRWIAQVTGLAATTVGAIRKCSTIPYVQSNARVGQDGRVRPLDSSEGRLLAAELMRADPSRSVRDIARSAGIAPSTALDVRNRLRTGAGPVPTPRERVRDSVSGRRAQPRIDPVVLLRRLHDDPSLRFTDLGRALLRWFGAHTVRDSPAATLIDNVPAHCVGALAALARHNADCWAQLGDQLTSRERDAEMLEQTP